MSQTTRQSRSMVATSTTTSDLHLLALTHELVVKVGSSTSNVDAHQNCGSSRRAGQYQKSLFCGESKLLTKALETQSKACTANYVVNYYANYVFNHLLAISRYISKVHHINDAFKERPLEPSDFCQKWVRSVAPGERGYYKACVKALAQATGLSERTIQGWGADFIGRPDSVLVTLRKEDIINQIRELVKLDNLSDYLEP